MSKLLPYVTMKNVIIVTEMQPAVTASVTFDLRQSELHP